jgi:ABC-type transport system involved in multi-copper enzyme maturation permease subunit
MSVFARTPFGAIFQTEVLLNTKRVVPYAMMALFGVNAWLWWARGAATHYGWATNGDYFILRNFMGFSFLTLPLFTALMMGDPVIRDFRTGVHPLILSKPLGRLAYLLGKFFGNYFVLFCCQAVFAVALILFQALRPAGMVVQPARVTPFVLHFVLLVGVSHMVLGAIYFTVGTLTRSPKLVYGLGVLFYPAYIIFQLLLRPLPSDWRIRLDPLLVNWPDLVRRAHGIEWENAAAINQLTFSYDSDLLINRVLVLLVAAVCLTILYFRFSRGEESRDGGPTTVLDLSGGNRDMIFSGAEGAAAAPSAETRDAPARVQARTPGSVVALPKVKMADEGAGTYFRQLLAAVGTEFRLLRAERGLIVLAPLAIAFSTLELFARFEPEVSYSGSYASTTAQTSLLFLIALVVFYTGEAMHRDREVRVEPVLWGAPVPNFVLLLSKFFATLLMSVALVALIGLTAVVIQFVKRDTPVELTAYLSVYGWILLPSVALAAALSIALNVLLRDKYLTYALSFATVGGLFYLYTQGYNHWLYNFVLYGLWTYADLAGTSGSHPPILTHRVYCLALTFMSLGLAHLFFPRRMEKGLEGEGPLGSNGWSILVTCVAVVVAVVAGVLLVLPEG